MTRLVCTSDWHGQLPNVPDGDVLIVAGDLLPVWDHNRQFQARWIREELAQHWASLSHEHIIVIAGNHDFILQESVKIQKELGAFVHYLQDSSVEINGVKFYGTPWVPVLARWAFYATDAELEAKVALIPDDTHVIISHGPPFGSLDKTCPMFGSMNAGSHQLRNRIVDIRPSLVVTGHIHEGYGRDLIGRTTIANVSYVDERYVPGNDPMVFDINP